MLDEIQLSELRVSIDTLFNSLQTMHLSTLDADAWPHASYTPYLKVDNKFYIYISKLAQHTQNLLAQPKLSLLLIEDETESRSVFARKRLSFQAEAKLIERSSDRWDALMDLFEEERGNTVNLLRSLSDFYLFELSCLSGTYVQGFGQAYHFQAMNFDTMTLLSS